MKRNLIIIAALLVLAVGGIAAWHHSVRPAAEELDLSTEKPTEKGLYTLTFAPAEGKPSTGPIHAWKLTVKGRDGAPVTGAEILVNGGMPQHGHGLPTSPGVTDEPEPGVYTIDGVKFSMSGWWVFDLTVKAAAGEDKARFNVVLE
ncbi:MAG: FixH family protein [Nitratireductor sp.]|nr:FixH family protein [Nitratireductor sp.]